jgi:hypothetical protein
VIAGVALAAAALAAAALAGALGLRRLFTEPGAAPVPSLTAALGARRVVGVFAHPDDEQLVTGLLLRASGAGPRWLAYTLTPRRAFARFGGELGRRVAAETPEATHRMPGEIRAKLRGWRIHASQRDFVRAEFGVPASVLHRLWSEELYRVVELGG